MIKKQSNSNAITAKEILENLKLSVPEESSIKRHNTAEYVVLPAGSKANQSNSLIILSDKDSQELFVKKCDEALAVISEITNERHELAPKILTVAVLSSIISTGVANEVNLSIQLLKEDLPRSIKERSYGPMLGNIRRTISLLVYPYSRMRARILEARLAASTAIEFNSIALIQGNLLKSVNYAFTSNFRNLSRKQTEELRECNPIKLKELLSDR